MAFSITGLHCIVTMTWGCHEAAFHEPVVIDVQHDTIPSHLLLPCLLCVRLEGCDATPTTAYRHVCRS